MIDVILSWSWPADGPHHHPEHFLSRRDPVGGNVDLGSFDVAHYQSLIRIIKLVLAPPNGIPMTGTSQLYNSNSPFKILLGSLSSIPDQLLVF